MELELQLALVMIKIPEVTLIMLADLDIEDAVYAVNKSCEGIHWGAAKFLSSKGRPKGLNPNVNYEEVYPIQSINDFNFYCICLLYTSPSPRD